MRPHRTGHFQNNVRSLPSRSRRVKVLKPTPRRLTRLQRSATLQDKVRWFAPKLGEKRFEMKRKYLIVFASMGFAGFLLGPSPALAQVSLGAAEDFAVLGGSAVTATDSAVEGNVGVALGGAVTQTTSKISGTVHVGDTVAQQAHVDFLAAYDALGLVQCDVDLTGQPLAGQSLTPGVYCFDAAVTETGGELTLSGPSDGIWIFKIGILGTGALTGTNFLVVMSGGETCNNNVSWWTADAATLTDSVFLGSVLAGTAATVTRGSLDGQALAKAAVTMTGTFVCGGPPPAL